MNSREQREPPAAVIRAGLAAVSQFEQDHGAFTTEGIADAEAWAARAVGLSGQSRASAGGLSA